MTFYELLKSEKEKLKMTWAQYCAHIGVKSVANYSRGFIPSPKALKRMKNINKLEAIIAIAETVKRRY